MSWKRVSDMSEKEYIGYRDKAALELLTEVALNNIKGFSDHDLTKEADGVFCIRIKGEQNYNHFMKAISATRGLREAMMSSYFVGTFTAVYRVKLKMPYADETACSYQWFQIPVLTKKEAIAYGARFG